jgi:hypothetical protein
MVAWCIQNTIATMIRITAIHPVRPTKLLWGIWGPNRNVRIVWDITRIILISVFFFVRATCLSRLFPIATLRMWNLTYGFRFRFDDILFRNVFRSGMWVWSMHLLLLLLVDDLRLLLEIDLRNVRLLISCPRCGRRRSSSTIITTTTIDLNFCTKVIIVMFIIPMKYLHYLDILSEDWVWWTWLSVLVLEVHL